MSLGDVESERDNLLEKLSDYEKVRLQLAELEEREALYIKNIDDLKTKQTFILVMIYDVTTLPELILLLVLGALQ